MFDGSLIISNDSNIKIALVYCISGAIGGIFMGLIGAGIGPIVVPTLVFILTQLAISKTVVMKIAIMTSLSVILVDSLFLTYIHSGNKNIEYKYFYYLLPGSILGALSGSMAVAFLSLSLMKYTFGVLLIFVGGHTILSTAKKTNYKCPSFPKLFIISFLIALISSMLGVSDGLLMVPFLKRYEIGITKAIGTATALIFPVSLSGALPLFITGIGNTALPDDSISYIYLPAFVFIVITSLSCSFLGAHFANKIPEKILKNIFCLVMICVGIKIVL